MILVIMAGSLVVLGCANPADGSNGVNGYDGDDGDPGDPGKVFISGDVTAEELRDAFEKAEEVVLQRGTTATTVYGVIPVKKTLVVYGEKAVKDGKSLEIEADGTLEIKAEAGLDASYVSGTAGYVKGSAAGITGAGGIVLPYLGAGGSLPADGISYNTAGVTLQKKAVGSYNTGVSTPATGGLTNANIVTIFGLQGGPSSLTAANITALTNTAVPLGKTLTLTGAANTITAALDISTKGTLIVAEGAKLTANVATAISANTTDSNVTINGELDLGVNGTITGTGKITNNGVISSATTTGTVQEWLITKPAGSGKVVLSGVGGAVLSAAAALTQNVEIANGGTLKAAAVAAPFSGNKTITILDGGTLDLGAALGTLSLTDVTIKNDEGTIDTATLSDKALQAILNAGVGGKVTSAGNVAISTQAPLTAFTVPANTEFTHDTGTFAGGAVPIVINGTATFTTGTFESQTGAVTVNGTATFTGATFAALTAALTINGDATFGAAIAPLAASTVTVNGTAEFTAAAAPLGDVTVGQDGELTVSGTGSLTIAAAKTLANAGTVALTGTGSVVLTGASATGGAKITGAGKLTAGATEIVGGTTGWQAVADSGSATITIASATVVTATITASANTVNLTAQGTGATITQLAGAVGNELTIAAATTVNLGAADASIAVGSIKLAKGTNPGKLTLTAADSIVLTLAVGTAGTALSSTITTFDTDAVTSGTAAEKVFLDGNDKLTKLVGASASITGTASGTGFNTIASTTAVTGS
jgi:hypothetical protein